MTPCYIFAVSGDQKEKGSMQGHPGWLWVEQDARPDLWKLWGWFNYRLCHTTALSQFQGWTMISVKNFSLISILNLPWHNLRLFLLILNATYPGMVSTVDYIRKNDPKPFPFPKRCHQVWWQPAPHPQSQLPSYISQHPLNISFSSALLFWEPFRIHVPEWVRQHQLAKNPAEPSWGHLGTFWPCNPHSAQSFWINTRARLSTSLERSGWRARTGREWETLIPTQPWFLESVVHHTSLLTHAAQKRKANHPHHTKKNPIPLLSAPKSEKLLGLWVKGSFPTQ